LGVGYTTTVSSVIWIYEVTNDICQNNIFPVVRVINLYWWSGVPLPQQQEQIKDLIIYWRVNKVTVDGIGIGRQIAESLEQTFGSYMINKYIATSTTISEDCFDLLARLNYSAVKMFRNDGSPEWAEFERQVGWTKYSSSQGKMTLSKPKAESHIDMVKALTYINRNAPSAITHMIYSNESVY
jgi:phage FluMu gp28-like protein